VRRHVRKLVLRFELGWYFGTVGTYAMALALVFILFPGVSNLWVAILILVGSLTSAIGDLITVLKERWVDD
jgi:hypothetical protein